MLLVNYPHLIAKSISSRIFMLSNNFLLFLKKLWQRRKKWSLVLGSILHEHDRFRQSAKSCLNLFSLRWQRPRPKRLRSLIPIGLWILYVDFLWGRPIFINEAFNKENDVVTFTYSLSSLHLFITFQKNEFLNVSVLQQ